jgi:hypothetical protein
MGHASVESTPLYQHLAEDYLREQDRKFESLVRMDKEKEVEPNDSTS